MRARVRRTDVSTGEGRDAPKLLVVCGAYSLRTLRQRDALQVITWRDLDGFFDHVWTVHPLVGASPEDASEALGPLSSQELAPRHTVVESRVGASRFLRLLPPLNFLVAQLRMLLHLSRLIRREGIAIVRVGDPYYLGLVGLVLARLNRISLVVCVNGNFDAIFESVGRLAYPRLLRHRRIEKSIERTVLSRADLTVTLNEDNRRFALNNGARTERTTVLPLGNMVASVHFREPRERDGVVEELGLSGRPFLIYVGRLEVVKHPEDVVAVLAEARATHRDLAALFVGRGSMQAELEMAAGEAGVAEAVVFAGERSQPWIASALAQAAVVVSPLTGFALVEACLSGTPVVAYDVEWHAELVQDDETGLLIPYRDTHAMAGAVTRILADRAFARSLGANARRRTLEIMDPRRLTDRHRRSYSALLAGGACSTDRR